MNSLTHIKASVAAAALVAGLAGCRSDATSGPESKSFVVEALTPTLIFGTVGGIASPGPSIRVTSSSWGHQPLPDIPVEFRVLSTSGSITNSRVVTDANGVAAPGEWVFATRPGDAYLTVIVKGSMEGTFIAKLKPDVPAKLYSDLPDQAGFPGESVSGPGGMVRDRFNNPIPGIAVEFEITAGGGRLDRSSATSDREGFVSAGSWQLGSLGKNVATARLPGVETIAFNAEALDAATIRWYQLDSLRFESKSFTPAASGVADGRLGITPFDACLCKSQEGFFIEERTYSDYGGYFGKSSGRYVLDGSRLRLPLLPEGAIEGGRVLIQRPDDDFGVVWTWVYKEIH